MVFVTKRHHMFFSPDLLLIRKPGLLQGARPLKERPGLSQGGRATYRESSPLTVRLGLASHRKARSLAWRVGSYRETLHWEARYFPGSQGLYQGGRASRTEVWPLTGRPGLLPGG